MSILAKKTIIVTFFSAVFLLLPFAPFVQEMHARTEQEITQDLENQKEQLDEISKELEKAKELLEKSESDYQSSNSELEKLKLEIEAIELEITVKQVELKNKLQQKKIKELEKDLKISQQREGVESSYMEWRSKSPFAQNMIEQRYDMSKNEKYTAFLLDENQNDIADLVSGVLAVSKSIQVYESDISTLHEQQKSLEEKKSELESRLASYYSIYADARGNVNGLQTTQESIQRTISNLTQEQQNAANRENEILDGGSPIIQPTPEDPPLDEGEGGAQKFVITGKGRDLYQGHGVGMSQWGAYGMALNHGYSYQNILTFYYASTNVSGGYESRTISVSGYGNMNIEQYVSGLGEVPNKACGTSEQANANPNKYVVDNPNTVWDCWPEHAIKAQVVAARTYALNYNGTICTTAACQVYAGGNGKQWAADETRGQVVTYSGNIINAVYSADNNQGAGTANNDTVWQNIDGNGYPLPYLRSKNDNSLAAYTQWTHWNYSTRQYTFADIDNLLAYGAGNSSPYSGSSRDYISNLKNSLGNVSGMSLEKDPSGRVKKVWLQGTSGQTLPLGGWWFKNLWVNWAYDTGTLDYIYSQTFNISYQ